MGWEKLPSWPYGPFRDVYPMLQRLRNFLIGRSPHPRHNRYNPCLAPRTLPRPDIPRGPEYKYSNQYYFDRNPINSVEPPVVAPVGLGACKKKGGPKETIECNPEPKHINFKKLPTPGMAYWWDAHAYYECIPDHKPEKPKPKKPIPEEVLVPSHVRQAKRAEECSVCNEKKPPPAKSDDD